MAEKQESYLIKDVAILIVEQCSNFDLNDLFLLRGISKNMKIEAEKAIMEKAEKFKDDGKKNITIILSRNPKVSLSGIKERGFLYNLINFELRLCSIVMKEDELEFSLEEVFAKPAAKPREILFKKMRNHFWTKELIMKYKEYFRFSDLTSIPEYENSEIIFTLEELRELTPHIKCPKRGFCKYNPHNIKNFLIKQKEIFYGIDELLGEDYCHTLISFLLSDHSIKDDRISKFIEKYQDVWSPYEWNHIKHLKRYLDLNFIRRQQNIGKIKWGINDDSRGSKLR